MNVLVTGGLGVIGSWVTRQLLEEGHRPVIYENRTDPLLVPDIIDDLEIVIGDILDLPTLIRTMKTYRIQCVCHLAGRLGQAAQANPWYSFQINAIGTLNVLEACRISEVERVVFTSSKAVYAIFTGEYTYPTYKPVNEDYPLYPDAKRHGIYGTAKLTSELLCLQYYQEYALNYVALRFSPLYGIGRIARHGTIAIYNKMIENAMLNKPTIIPHGGDEKTDLISVKDAANSIVLACFSQNLEHHVFNISNSQSYKLEDFANAVKAIFPDAVIEIGPGLDHVGIGPRYCVLDISRAKEELGFMPKYTLEEGIKDYIDTMKRLDIQPVYSP
ncbi:NAD-dependent epimerase/dehydratase family protein [Chloroflexota bacterium]